MLSLLNSFPQGFRMILILICNVAYTKEAVSKEEQPPCCCSCHFNFKRQIDKTITSTLDLLIFSVHSIAFTILSFINDGIFIGDYFLKPNWAKKWLGMVLSLLIRSDLIILIWSDNTSLTCKNTSTTQLILFYSFSASKSVNQHFRAKYKRRLTDFEALKLLKGRLGSTDSADMSETIFPPDLRKVRTLDERGRKLKANIDSCLDHVSLLTASWAYTRSGPCNMRV